jgi:MoaA/NifB/PqqE/SkfB family radical SAM enzyme
MQSLTMEEIDRYSESVELVFENQRANFTIDSEAPDEVRALVHEYSNILMPWGVAGYYEGSVSLGALFPPFPSSVAKRTLRGCMYRYFFGEIIPKVATLHITYRCQCRCGHCGVNAFRKPNTDELTTEQWKDIIDELTEAGVTTFIFFGGEPFLRDDIVELINYVDKSRAMCVMASNGLDVSSEILRRLKQSGLYYFCVSLDYPDAENHDRNRGIDGLFDEAVDTLRRAKAEGLLTGVSATVFKGSLKSGHYEAMLRLAGELGVNQITVCDYKPAGIKDIDSEWMIDPQERKAIVNRALELFSDPTLPNYFTYPVVSDADIQKNFFSNPVWQSFGIQGCFAGRTSVVVSAYGEVMPCNYLPLSFGNLLTRRFPDIWSGIINSEPFRDTCGYCRALDSDFRSRYLECHSECDSLPILYSL